MSAKPKDIIAYTNPLSVASGEMLEIKASTYGPDNIDLDFVRIEGAKWSDETGAIPELTPIEHPQAGNYSCATQPVQIGSYGKAPAPQNLTQSRRLTLAVLARPQAKTANRQALLALEGANRKSWVLALNDKSQPVLFGPDGCELILADNPLKRLTWYAIAVSIDLAENHIELRVTEFSTGGHEITTADYNGVSDFSEIQQIWFAAAPDHNRVTGNFDGCLESPMICESSAQGALDAIVASPNGWQRLGERILGLWNFSREITTDNIIDSGPSRCDGRLFNSPTRAIRGAFWSGEAFDWPSRPQEYGAIHFHSDDLDDCHWNTTAQIKIPDDWASGLYAARLRTNSHEDLVPFVVRAPSNNRKAVTFLLPSFTYTSYANAQPALRGPDLGIARYQDEATLAAHPEFGHSQYDHYADRSPVMLSSRNRPILSMRINALPWGLLPDLWILSWLKSCGIDYDIICDEDLDRDGLNALCGTEVVITGNHPEYYTKEMLDALDAFVDRGRRMMYMGGNGFYWRVSHNKHRPGQIEVRRNEDGTRAWIGEPGEGYHAMDGEYGGLWRRLSRPPNRLAGVGFAAQGFDESGYFEVETGARTSPAAFALTGIDSDKIGEHGIIGGGAAGQEIDRVDGRLSDISNTHILARSSGHPQSMLRTKEELLSTILPFEDRNAKAHLAMRFTKNNGAVFSVGSMAWAGSLPTNNFDNDVAKISTNVLKRFLDHKGFDAE